MHRPNYCGDAPAEKKESAVRFQDKEPADGDRDALKLCYPNPYYAKEPDMETCCLVGEEIKKLIALMEPDDFIACQTEVNTFLCHLLSAETAFILFTTKDEDMLYLSVMGEEAVGPITFSIAGSIFSTIFQKKVNEPIRHMSEAHNLLFKRFSRIVMRSFLCVPFFYPKYSTNITFLICLINKQLPVRESEKIVVHGAKNTLTSTCEFSQDDEDILERIFDEAGSVLMESVTLSRDRVNAYKKNQILGLAAIKAPLGQITEYIKIIMLKAKTVLFSENCSFMFVDRNKSEFIPKVLDGAMLKANIKDIRLSINHSIFGQVAKTGVPMIMALPFNIQFKSKKNKSVTTLEVLNMLCFPIKLNGEVVAVAEFSNKLEDDSYTEEDKELCIVLADVMKLITSRSLLAYLRLN